MTGIRKNQRGVTMLEFVLVGICMIFMLISLFEVSRGLWAYHTLAYAVREGTRYAAMHGIDCASPNTCGGTVGNIITYMRAQGGGFDPDNTTLTFTPQNGTTTSGTMTSLTGSTTSYPPSTSYAQGNWVKISATYSFHSILAMFWVGSAPVKDSKIIYLTASSTELIQF